MYEISPESYLDQYHMERDTLDMKSKASIPEIGRFRKRNSFIPLLLSIVFHRVLRKRL